MLELIKSECIDDWYVLEGGGNNRASIEGVGYEWEFIAQMLNGEADNAEFRRCCCEVTGGGDSFRFYSPRNSHGISDQAFILKEEAPELAQHIRKVLEAYKRG